MDVIFGVTRAIFLHPDLRDLRGIGMQGKLHWQHISDDGHSAPRSTGVLFDNGLDRCSVCRVALAPPASGVDRTH